MRVHNLSITSLKEGLKRKEFSAREIAGEYLDAIKNKDGEIGAYLEVNEGVLSDAERIDELVARGEVLPLAGVPVAVKDNIVTMDATVTAGSKLLRSYKGAYNATVVERLRTAGALILGKTNLDEFAMGSSTENSAFKITKNPRDLTRVPGGSSGGSAAAVAGGLALAALGSDTGGSIRQPAAFTGIVGFKPTYGRVSRHGLIAMASSLDQIGPLSKTVEDAARLYEIIAGFDRYDSTSIEREVEPATEVDLRGLKIGVPGEYFAEGLDSRMKETVKAAIKKFESAGALVSEISLPHAKYALPVYYIVMFAEVSANLARFDGFRYGSRFAEEGSLIDYYKINRDEGFGAEVKRRIIVGTYVLSHGYYDAYYVKAQKVRRLIRGDFEKAFTDVDVIMGPTTPSAAFKIGGKTTDPLSMYLEDIYTVAINLAGVPAISIPCGTINEEGVSLPAGLQIIGPWFNEARLLGAASACERLLEFSGHL